MQFSQTMSQSAYVNNVIQIHRPQVYLEIGVATGRTLFSPPFPPLSIGVDPAFSSTVPQTEQGTIMVFKMTSDEMFDKGIIDETLSGRHIDLAFIDGMHLCEYVMRDFINTVARCRKGSLILIHDMFPKSIEHASRERTQDVWTGDVYRFGVALMRYNPGFPIAFIGDTAGTGMALVRVVDPTLRFAVTPEEMTQFMLSLPPQQGVPILRKHALSVKSKTHILFLANQLKARRV
ncbi:class I SAM-dependent methyltransferase [Desulfovibrio inopinatus]|uniref:class I SAM-dependent methyltransferase n=1 Tax=Desulfovibrio inopinatus TaxID=102109 RepID=UPI000426EDF5|nr:class I SAM-dependent methyltransferase [Desulfovibrio inopinatus]